MNEGDPYQRLAEHLDHLPGGFPPSQTGADLRILRNLFTPEEAEVAVNLTLDREEAKTIAKRAGLSAAETERRLEEMSKKGLIFSIHLPNGLALYQAISYVIGIWEFQVNNLKAGLLKEMGEWQRTSQPRQLPVTARQMRTIPIGKSIPIHLQVLPWEKVDELLKDQDRFAVAPCICRRVAKIAGAGCNAPEESCLALGDFADFYIRTGRGRPIERSEVEKILNRADEFNLVLQPSNSQQAEFICCCCGDCCGVLRSAKSHPRPSEVVSSGFVSHFEKDKCDGCQTCLERCQMQALSADSDKVILKEERCIGCGLCTSTCPSGALTLERRPGFVDNPIPARWNDTLRFLSKIGQ